MKKIICLEDVFRANCKKGDIFDLVEDGEDYWDILINNRIHRVSKFFKEFMTLNEYRKFKLQKIEKYE